jgi:UDP-N-acetylmuramoyl-L-alanyl-D-glutamate--2,6-diaminopimelate ligase
MMVAPTTHTGMQLGELLAGIAALPAVRDVLVTGIALDSRKVRPGDLFLACPGRNSDGRSYIPQALRAGAAAIAIQADQVPETLEHQGLAAVAVPDLAQRAGLIAARFYGEPSRALQLTGVTGTNGKTSVAWYLAQSLSVDSHRCGLLGTLGYGIYGEPLTAALNTTPDPVNLQAWLAQWRAQGLRQGVLEVSSHALDQGRVNGVVFDTAVFTNLTRDHLDYHTDMSDYAAAKRRLFCFPELRHAVINLDDPFGRELAAALPADVQLTAYGLESPNADIKGEIVSADRNNLEVAVSSDWGAGRLQAALSGRFNAGNLLAVLAVLLLRGVAFEQALQRLSRVQPPPGRMQTFGGGAHALVIVDYAHTPDALAQVLQALRAQCRGRLWCVFGCGGDRDHGKRPEMGAVAECYADQVVLTSDNPRSEAPEHIIADILAGLHRPEVARVEPDRALAITHAIQSAAPADTILIAGEGHETDQEIAGVRHPFSDQQVVQACLQSSQ